MQHHVSIPFCLLHASESDSERRVWEGWAGERAPGHLTSGHKMLVAAGSITRRE
jgi:hypothetical protein